MRDEDRPRCVGALGPALATAAADAPHADRPRRAGSEQHVGHLRLAVDHEAVPPRSRPGRIPTSRSAQFLTDARIHAASRRWSARCRTTPPPATSRRRVGDAAAVRPQPGQRLAGHASRNWAATSIASPTLPQRAGVRDDARAWTMSDATRAGRRREAIGTYLATADDSRPPHRRAARGAGAGGSTTRPSRRAVHGRPTCAAPATAMRRHADDSWRCSKRSLPTLDERRRALARRGARTSRRAAAAVRRAAATVSDGGRAHPLPRRLSPRPGAGHRRRRRHPRLRRRAGAAAGGATRASARRCATSPGCCARSVTRR